MPVRKPFIVYKRRAGITAKKKDHYQYYAAFWNPERQLYDRRRATSQTSEAAAEAVARRWLDDGIPEASSLSLHDYLDQFWAADGAYARGWVLRGRPLAADYLVSMRSAVTRHVLPWLKKTRRSRLLLAAVTPKILEELVLALHGSELSARRVNGIRQAVGVAMGEAKRLGMIPRNPMSEVLKLAESKPQREILTIAEARKVLGWSWPDDRYRLINMLAAASGMRLGECRGLQADDVIRDGDAWRIVVQHNWQDGEGLKEPKWGSRRPVPIPARLAEKLQELAAANVWENGFVFPGARRDVPLAKRAISETFNTAVRAAGIAEADRRRRRITFHAWRHWYVAYIRGKIPDHALQQLTRHRSEQMLDRYSPVTEEQRRAVAELTKGLL